MLGLRSVVWREVHEEKGMGILSLRHQQHELGEGRPKNGVQVVDTARNQEIGYHGFCK